MVQHSVWEQIWRREDVLDCGPFAVCRLASWRETCGRWIQNPSRIPTRIVQGMLPLNDSSWDDEDDALGLVNLLSIPV